MGDGYQVDKFVENFSDRTLYKISNSGKIVLNPDLSEKQLWMLAKGDTQYFLNTILKHPNLTRELYIWLLGKYYGKNKKSFLLSPYAPNFLFNQVLDGGNVSEVAAMMRNPHLPDPILLKIVTNRRLFKQVEVRKAYRKRKNVPEYITILADLAS